MIVKSDGPALAALTKERGYNQNRRKTGEGRYRPAYSSAPIPIATPLTEAAFALSIPL
jgi:hypothetical protein